VPVSDLTPFIRQIFERAGMPAWNAQTMADLLVLTDLRGVFTHGTRQTPYYASLVKTRRVNPAPRVSVVRDDPTTAVLDGDGGMGHFPSLVAADMATRKAKEYGLGCVVTRNHNHIGAAGKYSRIPTQSGCVGFATSSHIFPLVPGAGSITHAGGSSPISFAFPNGTEPPVVLDMASTFASPTEEVCREFPAGVFKALGLGVTCAGLAKVMAGVVDLHKTGKNLYPGADQGGLVLAIDIERFIPLEVFKRDMDEFVRHCRTMKPIPGYDRSDLPGNLEWERERGWRQIGVPISPDHQAALEAAAREFGVPSPFSRFLHKVS
jgi:LDH2 family malate/lactate/ureidoglycolate dehydrogenase